MSQRRTPLVAAGISADVALSLLMPSSAHASLFNNLLKVPDDKTLDRPLDYPETPAARIVNPPLDKLNRGFTNMFTSFIEWPLTARDWHRNKHNWAVSLAVMPIVGTGRLLQRFGSGVVDVLTFPVSVPRQPLWVDKPSIVHATTARANWVLDEASTAQQDLSAAIQPQLTP